MTPGTQTLRFLKHFLLKGTRLPGEMAEFRAAAGKARLEPGTSCLPESKEMLTKVGCHRDGEPARWGTQGPAFGVV